MDDRIHRALDGDLPIDQLTPDECAELHRYRATIGRALAPIAHLRSIDVASEVMDRVAPGLVRRAFSRVVAWLWSPRALSFTIRPAFAMAGTLAVLVGLLFSAKGSVPAGHPGPARVMVQFRLGAPAAREVALIGDFNGWRPGHRLRQVAAGVWSVDVALEPGVYQYVFVIDGKTWRLDPLAPRVADGLGGASSRVDVLPPELRS